MKYFLINSKDKEKSAFIWNMIAYTSNSFQSLILLLVITRDENYIDSAIFSIAFTMASMFLHIGKFGVRNYQVSDVNNEFTYAEYCKTRAITVTTMFIASAIYLGGCMVTKDYSLYKVACCLSIIAVRVIEAVEDVIHGELQKKLRLDVASKIWGIRNIAYVIVFIIAYIISRSLLISASVGLGTTFILFVVLNSMVKDLYENKKELDDIKIKRILHNCWPLALSTFVTVYIGNSPKYTVDSIMTSVEQTQFNVVFMPVFVIALLGNYIYNPLVTKLTEMWKNNDIQSFSKSIIKQIKIVLLFTLIIVVGGELVGLRILEILYNVSLMSYRLEFTFLMVAGGGLAVFNFIMIIATIIRRQNVVKHTSLISAILLVLCSRFILERLGITFLCMYYMVVVLIMVLVALFSCSKYIKEGNLEND